MSSTIETDMKTHSFTTLWGGDETGVVVQVTCTDPYDMSPEAVHNQEGFILLNLSEASALCNALNDYIVKECNRRKALLQEELELRQKLRGTIFNEVSKLDENTFKVSHLSTTLVDKFCPIIRGWKND